MIQADLFQVLSADPTVTAIVGPRIYPKRLPSSCPVPAVVYTVNDITPIRSLNGESGLNSCDIEVVCWAKDYSAAHALAATVRAALLDSGIAINTDMSQDTEDEDTRNFGVLIHLVAWSSSTLSQPGQRLTSQYTTAFSFTATEGQTEFTLPNIYKPNGFCFLAINGAVQNKESGDFLIAGNKLTITEGLDDGDKVYGFFEIV